MDIYDQKENNMESTLGNIEQKAASCCAGAMAGLATDTSDSRSRKLRVSKICQQVIAKASSDMRAHSRNVDNLERLTDWLQTYSYAIPDDVMDMILHLITKP